eukprot:scaffold38511_cov74-Phaeocystis_antarctica.AAC.2
MFVVTCVRHIVLSTVVIGGNARVAAGRLRVICGWACFAPIFTPLFPNQSTLHPVLLASFDDTQDSKVMPLARLPPSVPALAAPRPQLQLHSLRPPPPSADRSVLLN